MYISARWAGGEHNGGEGTHVTIDHRYVIDREREEYVQTRPQGDRPDRSACMSGRSAEWQAKGATLG